MVLNRSLTLCLHTKICKSVATPTIQHRGAKVGIDGTVIFLPCNTIFLLAVLFCLAVVFFCIIKTVSMELAHEIGVHNLDISICVCDITERVGSYVQPKQKLKLGP